MVLLCNGVLQSTGPLDFKSLFHSQPAYKQSAAAFLKIPKKVIGPNGLLYIHQRELAATVPEDKYVSIIGSDDATTCIIVVMRDSDSGVVAMAHLDDSSTDQALRTMVQRIQELSLGNPTGKIELQIFGGFNDADNYSENLFANIMREIHRQPVEIDLTMACVGELNTTIRDSINWPIIFGIGIYVNSGEIFPATFLDKGPDQPLRLARTLFGDSQTMDVYDCKLGQLRIGPFDYKLTTGVNKWLKRSDEYLLQNWSTSPQVEPPHVAKQLRDTLMYTLENPHPRKTVFKGNQAHCFRRKENEEICDKWIPILP